MEAEDIDFSTIEKDTEEMEEHYKECLNKLSNIK
jgi:hypothetical protein